MNEADSYCFQFLTAPGDATWQGGKPDLVQVPVCSPVQHGISHSQGLLLVRREKWFQEEPVSAHSPGPSDFASHLGSGFASLKMSYNPL